MPQLRRSLVPLTSLLSAVAMWAADINSPVVSQMRLAVPGADQIQILQRIEASSGLDLVLAMASPKGWPPFSAESSAWYPDRRLGIFLQSRNQAGTVYKISIEKGPDCDSTWIARVTATDLVVSCLNEKNIDREPNRKFVYDIRSKALTGKFEYRPFPLSRLFLSNGNAVLIGTDHKQVVAVQVDPSSNPRLLSGQALERWTNRVHLNYPNAGIVVESVPTISLPPKPFRTLRFGLENRFALEAKPKESDSQPAYGFWVTERTGNRTRHYRLPQSTYEEFAKARPKEAKGIDPPSAIELGEEIGPAQLLEGNLWIAKTFYDGEGADGIGGFGYFDTTNKKFKIYSPPEVTDYSATAMLVEPDAIWLGLEVNAEYGSISKGLLRFDRKTEKALRIPLPDLIYEIARLGDRLVIATDFGVAIVDADGKMRRFFVDKNMRGNLQVSEATSVSSEKIPTDTQSAR